MITKYFLKTTKWKFQKECTEESNQDCTNPGRGWYRLYSFNPKEGFPREDWYWGLVPTEQLALLMIDLGSFSNRAIGQEALANIKQAFAFFKENGKELILRFVYDRKGEGMRFEPSSVSLIKEHMRQLAPILKSYETSIFTIQGLFIGNWGEMHGSKFLTEPYLLELWDQLLEITPENCFLAVRTPSYWRQVTGISNGTIFPQGDFLREQRLGLYNDGLLGSETDLGTYGQGEVQKELDFQNQLCSYVPNGGEAVGDAPWGELSNAVQHFSKLHISYLNSVYDEQVLERWKNSEYEGINGYAYIGMHLGYRFVVKEVKLTNRKVPRLIITVENKGFAPIYEECQLQLLLKDSFGQVQTIDIDMDARDWKPGVSVTFPIEIDACMNNNSGQSYRCSLCLRRKKDGHPIQFANREATTTLLLGRVFHG